MNAKNITLSLLLITANFINCDTSESVSNSPETIETIKDVKLQDILSAAELERIAQVESLIKKIQTSKETINLALAEYNLNQRYKEFYNARRDCLENNNCHMSVELKETFDAFNKAGIKYAEATKQLDESDCKKVDAESLLQLMKQQQLN